MTPLLTTWKEQVVNWLTTFGPTVVAVIIGAVIVSWIAAIAARKGVRRLVARNEDLSSSERNQRIKTLQRVCVGGIKILIWVVALLVLLSEVGIDIGPVLATAGVAGVALGFGAQYLVSDIITGFFILIENQYSVGDVVCINQDICGTVEEVTLRMTRLRDLDGVVHHVPNSEITVASNTSKHYSRINLDIGISYESDLDTAINIVNEVGNELATDSDWQDKVIEAPQFLRVEELGDSAVILKVVGDVKPATQHAVSGELRKRLKAAFEAANIGMPYPQRVIHRAQQ